MKLSTLIVVTIAFVGGVAAQTQYSFSVMVAVWLGVVSLTLALVWRRRSEASSAPLVLLTSVAVLSVALGMFRLETASWQFGHSSFESLVDTEVELTGVVVKEPDLREHNQQLYVQVEKDLVLVFVNRLYPVKYGDTIEVKGRLSKPESFTTDLGREFDYKQYLLARGVEYQISFADITILESGSGNFIIRWLLFCKQEFIQSLDVVLPEPQVGLGKGLLLGVKSALGDDIEENFRKTGIIHIVVLSGYNVMLVVSFIMLVFSYLFTPRTRVVFGIGAIVGFALIVGLSATVVRASIMAGLVLLAQWAGRQHDVLRALLLAGMIMVCINPYIVLYDIGFQLSFMATLGLVLLVPTFETRILAGKSFFGVTGFFLATVATQIAVLPLLMYHIGEISVVAVLVNMLVLPIVPVAMLLTFMAGVLAFVFPSAALLLAAVANTSLIYILSVAAFFAQLPLATVAVPQFSVWWVFGSYGIFLTGYWVYRYTKAFDTQSIADWEIIEESEMVKKLEGREKARQPKAAAPNQDKNTPVFFR